MSRSEEEWDALAFEASRRHGRGDGWRTGGLVLLGGLVVLAVLALLVPSVAWKFVGAAGLVLYVVLGSWFRRRRWLGVEPTNRSVTGAWGAEAVDAQRRRSRRR